MEKHPDFRPAERKDVPLILDFIRALAEYERMADQVVADEATLEEWLFDRGKAEVIFAVLEEKEVELCPVFPQLLHVPGSGGDLSGGPVRPAGIPGPGRGQSHFEASGGPGCGAGCGRLEWWCLDWNAPSIAFTAPWGRSP